MLLSDVCIRTTFDVPTDKLTFERGFSGAWSGYDAAAASEGEPDASCTASFGSCDAASLPPSTSYSSSSPSFIRTLIHPFTCWDAAQFLTLARDGRSRRSGQRLAVSPEEFESRHAFFPLFPSSVEALTSRLFAPLRVSADSDAARPYVPAFPDWCYVSSGLILNALFFCVSAVALYHFTALKLWRQRRPNTPSSPRLERLHAATVDLVLLLFLCNPANVFFTSNYAESLFSAAAFTSYYLLELSVNAFVLDNDVPKYLCCGVLAAPALLAASYTKSHGMIISVVVASQMVTMVDHVVRSSCGSPSSSSSSFRRLVRVTLSLPPLLLLSSVQLLASLSPSFLHDRSGFELYCVSSVPPHPWCGSYKSGTWQHNSIYSYVQSSYWDVGLGRYYELRNAPNFALSVPILYLAFGAGLCWIRTDFEAWIERVEGVAPADDSSFPVNGGRVARWVAWSISSRSMQSAKPASLEVERSRNSVIANLHEDALSSIEFRRLLRFAGLHSPSCRDQYAILVALCGAILVAANVQVATRIAASTCPAMYWHAAARIMVNGRDARSEAGAKEENKEREGGEKVDEGKEDFNTLGGILEDISHYVSFILSFFFVYNFLGVLLHPNFLPWT